MRTFTGNYAGRSLCLLLVLLSFLPGYAQDLVRVAPVTNKILMVTLDEGHVDYHDVYGENGSSIPYYSPVNTANAENKANYVITSPNDGNYATARQPLNLGRKAKGQEYVDYYAAVKHILEHSVYIELPTSLVRGRSYTVTVNNVVQNRNSFTFVYDEKNLLSPTLHVNQVGFVPGGAKYAYLSQWMGSFNAGVHTNGGLELDAYAGAQFQLVRASDNTVVFTGTIAKRKDKSTTETNNADFGASKNFTNADVWECNFSGYSTPGQYYVAVDNIGRSLPFEIAENAYRNAYHAVSKAIFTQRQGVDKELEGGKVYPRGHHPDDRNVWFTGTTTKVNVWGYYYDAGDWDGHNRHIGVPMDLMLCYDFKPGNFKDGDVGNRYRLSSTSAWVNEGSDGVPDILNEAKWLVSFYKRAKDALIAAGKGSGGVIGGRLPHQNGVYGEGYIGPDAEAEGRNSWTDTRPVYVNAEQTENTYLFSGAAAYYAVVLNKFNNGTVTAESTAWRTEAVNAYNWADARSDDEVGDGNVKGKILGSACLYRLTGEVKYLNDLKRLLPLDNTYPGNDAWQRMEAWQYAAMIIGMCPPNHPNLDVAFQTTLKNHIISHADNDYVNPANNRGFRFGFNDYRHTSNGAFSVPRMEMVAFAYEMTKDPKYLQQIQNAASYTLGGNENNMTYVAGLGHISDDKTFHPDAWKLIDFNSKVYTNPSFPGYSNYYGHKTCDFFGCGFNFGGDEDYARSTASPGIAAWPAGEWRMNNRYTIAGSEFTVEETLSQTAFTYGYLSGSASVAFAPNTRPTVALNFSENQNFPKAGCNLTVTASADTRTVKYYYDWHFIGESTDKASNFAFYWVPPQASGTTVLVTAVGYDDRGLITLPADAGDRNLVITTAASCTATSVAVTGVSVSPTSASLNVGATQQLTATVAPANATNQNVTWSSSNTSVATVNGSGLVTGVAAGTATITVTTQDGAKTATAAITVTTGTANNTCGLITNSSFESDLTGWTNGGSAAVSNSANSGTKAAVLGTAEGGLTYGSLLSSQSGQTLNVEVYAKVESAPSWAGFGVDYLDVAGAEIAEKVITVTTTAYSRYAISEAVPANTSSIRLWTWKSGTVGKVYFDDFCLTLQGGSTTVPVTGVSVSPTSASLNVGATQQLTATVAPANATNQNVTWSSSNTSVATVNSSGLVTAVAAGTATITVTTQDGAKTATAAITVTAATSLTHQWRFNNSGKDEIGTNDAVLQNSAAYTTTAKEGVAALNLATSVSANASVGVINLGSVFSVTLWAYNTGDQIHQNWLMSNSDGSVPGFRFFVNAYNTTDGKVAFENRGTSTTDYSMSAAGAFKFNQWNFVALVVNGSAYTVYVNGTSVHTGTVQAGTNFNRALYIGSMGDGNVWNTWKGYLDDVKTHNKALSAAEVQAAGAARLAGALAATEAGDDLTVFPNPASRSIRVSFTARSRQSARFTLTNALGQPVQSRLRDVEPGVNTVLLPIHLRSGLYHLSVEKDGQRTVRKVLVE